MISTFEYFVTHLLRKSYFMSKNCSQLEKVLQARNLWESTNIFYATCLKYPTRIMMTYFLTKSFSTFPSPFSKQRLGWAGRPTSSSKQVRFLVIIPPPHSFLCPVAELIWHSPQDPCFHWYLRIKHQPLNIHSNLT